MIYILLLLLIDAEEEVIGIFNEMDNEKKIIIKRGFKKIFTDEFDKEIALYKEIYKKYEDKRVELSILHAFGLEQDFIEQTYTLNDDIDYQLFTDFQNVDSLEDMK